jgi:hypothetical protein
MCSSAKEYACGVSATPQVIRETRDENSSHAPVLQLHAATPYHFVKGHALDLVGGVPPGDDTHDASHNHTND